MYIGTTSTGETINFSDNFDTAMIIFPKLEAQFNITGDLINSGNPIVMQEAGNTFTPVRNYAGHVFFNHDGNMNGNGTVTVVKGSNADKCFLASYNTVNHIKDGGNKAWFDVYCFNSATVDETGNATQWVMASGCYFTKQSPFQITATNSNGEQWTFTAKRIKRIGGRTDNTSFQDSIPNSVTKTTPNGTLWDENTTATANADAPTGDDISNAEKRLNRWENNMHNYTRPSNQNNGNSSEIDYSQYPLPNKDWDAHKASRWAKNHGYPYNPSDL